VESYKGHVHFAEALNSDVVRLARFIEFDKRNYATFSLENGRLLLAACTEIEAMLKQLCFHVEPKIKAERIDQYFSVVSQHFSDLFEASAGSPAHDISFKPWNEWKALMGRAPRWWKAHQNLKHGRHVCFQEASLENLLNAVAALEIVLLLCFYKLYMQQKAVFPFDFKSNRTFLAQL
jgi:hypothetical protein